MPSPADTLSPPSRKPLDARVELLVALARSLHCAACQPIGWSRRWRGWPTGWVWGCKS